MSGTPLTVELASASGARIAALEHVDDLRVTSVRNRPMVVSGSIYIPKERYAVSQWYEYKSRLLVYLGDQLIAHTLVGACEESIEAGQQTLRFASADPSAAPFGRRRVQADTTYTTTDQGAIVKARIDAQNARSSTFIGTTAYSFTTGTNRTVTVTKGKPESEIIADLTNAFDGLDFAVVPTDTSSTTMGQARVWSERGRLLTNMALEAGPTGKRNVDKFTVSMDPSAITTHQRVTGNNTETSAANTTTQTNYGTIHDSLDTLSDVTSTTMLDAVRDQLLAWRSVPRRVVTITPTGAMQYLPVRDFDVADFIPVHLAGGRWVNGREIAGAVRCYGWELSRDAGGAAVVSGISLLPDDQGGL